MGTVWRLSLDVVPVDALSYHKFRYGLAERIANDFGCDSDIYVVVNKDLPHVSGPFVIFVADFGGSYGVGEKVFNHFKEYIDKYMKNGSTVTVRSWEDASGDFVYTKGGNNVNIQ